MPTLLFDRPRPVELTLTTVVPFVFGLVTGAMLGISEPAYLVLSLLGIGGGFFAGLEHESALEGFYRGILGGLLFGAGILIAHGIANVEPEARVPDPESMLLVVTGGLGALLGTLGGRMRERRASRA